jgi:hypothetical protein
MLETSSGPRSMKDMQAHAKKIRSDAAECLVLSNLVTEERRPLFGRIAEHLNSLALEIETEAVNGISNNPGVLPNHQGTFPEEPPPPADHKRAASFWRQLPWSLLVALITAAAVIWAVRVTGITFSNLPPSTASKFENSTHELTSLLSEERDRRKAYNDQVSALITRLDDLAKQLDDLKRARAENPAPSTEGGASQAGQSPGTRAQPPPVEAADIPAETSSTSPAIPAAAAAPKDLTPASASQSVEASDQVGTVSTTRAESEPRKPTTGPAGCVHFHSFDPVSGTYTTFDGRRRQCR